MFIAFTCEGVVPGLPGSTPAVQVAPRRTKHVSHCEVVTLHLYHPLSTTNLVATSSHCWLLASHFDHTTAHRRLGHDLRVMTKAYSQVRGSVTLRFLPPGQLLLSPFGYTCALPL